MNKLVLIFLLASNAAWAQSEECPTSPDYVINDYEAYAIEFAETGQSQLEEIADELSENYENVESVAVIGHSSIFGNTDIQQASLNRAEFVNDRLITMIDGMAGDRDHNFQYIGKGGDCPLASNSTRLNRSINRRVEIFVTYHSESDGNEEESTFEDSSETEDNESAHEDTNNSEQEGESEIDENNSKLPKDNPNKLISFNKTLLKVRQGTNSKTLKCMLHNVRIEDSDHRYLTPQSINRILANTSNMRTKKKVEIEVKELRNQLIKVHDRLQKQHQGEEFITRFEKSVASKQRKLTQAINRLNSKANCKDKNVVAMRRWLLVQQHRDGSLYSCPKISKRIDKMMNTIGGRVKACGK